MLRPTNFDLARELAERSGTDWQFGALSVPALVSIPPFEREQYLPLGETQFDQYTDFTDCASRSPVNHLEAVFTYHYAHAMLPENKKWFEDNNYVQNGKITFSDRYIALLSGTTHGGNSLKSPLEAIRKQGLVPKALLPKEDWMKWEDYYDPNKITPTLKNLGQEFLKRFTLNYEQVAPVHFADVLKDDMIGVAGYAWPAPDANDVYHSANDAFNHAFLVYNLPKYQIFDNYMEAPGDFTKNLAPDYKLYEYVYRMYIAAEKKSEEVNDSTTIPQSILDSIQAIIDGIRKFIATYIPTTEPDHNETMDPTPPIPRSKIQDWALAVQHEEGGKPNDRNIRNHNPGNLKYTDFTASLGNKVGAAEMFGMVTRDPDNFCIFETYEKGFKALCTFLTDAANDLLIPYHATQYRNLKGFTQQYANPPANHPYAENVALALGVPVNIPIKMLL